jgi:hypothetical protein
VSLVGVTEGELAPVLKPGDSLCTPAWLWGIVAGHLGEIVCDPCACPSSTVEAPVRHFGPQAGGVDGLAVDWPTYEGSLGPVFVNCPYGRGHLRPWARKCVAEAARGAEVVLLVPVSPSTVWWQSCLPTVRAVAYLNDRVRFDGGHHGSGMFDSALLYWGPRPHLFLHAFAAFADGRFVR